MNSALSMIYSDTLGRVLVAVEVPVPVLAAAEEDVNALVAFWADEAVEDVPEVCVQFGAKPSKSQIQKKFEKLTVRFMSFVLFSCYFSFRFTTLRV
jgi:hypothetical protein